MRKEFKIENRVIGHAHPCFCVAEMSGNHLQDYGRAVVIVSHDRMFLDKLADVVYEIEYGTATRYPGNYSAFIERKRQNWEKQLKDYTQQQKEIERLRTAPMGTVLYYEAGGAIPREQMSILQEAAISHTISSDSQYTYCIKG